MSMPDLNLLITLDAVLAEGSVARAARRLHLSPSAMSRALARLRETTGDPLLVRAGRGLVATPRALELRERVSHLLQEAQVLLRPAGLLDLQQLDRTFTLRSREGFVENFGAGLFARVSAEAPGVRLCFLPKPDKDSSVLRDGSVDLDVGVVGTGSSPEMRTRILFRDRWLGVVRQGHVLCDGPITPERFAQGRHLAISRRGLARGPVDEALASMGLTRQIATLAASFSAALALARGSDLIVCVPARLSGVLRHGLHGFELPFIAPEITVALLWHPRHDADQAHRWLRSLLYELCGTTASDAALHQDFATTPLL